MESDSWIKVLHELGTIIAATGAAIAAYSSLRNGRTLKKSDEDKLQSVGSPPRVEETKTPRKRRPADDWYSPPEF